MSVSVCVFNVTAVTLNIKHLTDLSSSISKFLFVNRVKEQPFIQLTILWVGDLGLGFPRAVLIYFFEKILVYNTV